MFKRIIPGVVVILILLTVLFLLNSRECKSAEVPELTVVNKSGGVHCSIVYPNGCTVEGLCANLLYNVNVSEGGSGLQYFYTTNCSEVK